MTNYTIKQRFDMLSTPTAIFDEKYDDINSCVCIVEQKGQTGMVMTNGDIILPFKYDNISLMGKDLYMLIKNGKQGILHAKGRVVDEIYSFEILMQTECIYDYVSGLSRFQKSFVALRKDVPHGFDYQIYFTETNQIGADCSKIDYMDGDYVVVTDVDGRNKSCYGRTGELIFTAQNQGECAIIVFEPFETKAGTVFVMLQSDETFELVFVERCRKAQFKHRSGDSSLYYEWSGNTKHIYVDEFLYPILADERFHTFDRDCALAFMVKNKGKTVLLNECCERMEELDEKYCITCKRQFEKPE